jgi:hypothetical protein
MQNNTSIMDNLDRAYTLVVEDYGSDDFVAKTLLEVTQHLKNMLVAIDMKKGENGK